MRVCVCVPVCRRPEIAKLNGLKCDIFKDDTEAAIAATNEIIARNRKLFPHIGNSRDVLTTVAPHITSKFFYIHVEGVIIACMHCLHMLRSHARMQHFYTPNKGESGQREYETFRLRDHEITMARISKNVEEEEEKRLTFSKFAYVADRQIEAISSTHCNS